MRSILALLVLGALLSISFVGEAADKATTEKATVEVLKMDVQVQPIVITTCYDYGVCYTGSNLNVVYTFNQKPSSRVATSLTRSEKPQLLKSYVLQDAIKPQVNHFGKSTIRML